MRAVLVALVTIVVFLAPVDVSNADDHCASREWSYSWQGTAERHIRVPGQFVNWLMEGPMRCVVFPEKGSLPAMTRRVMTLRPNGDVAHHWEFERLVWVSYSDRHRRLAIAKAACLASESIVECYDYEGDLRWSATGASGEMHFCENGDLIVAGSATGDEMCRQPSIRFSQSGQTMWRIPLSFRSAIGPTSRGGFAGIRESGELVHVSARGEILCSSEAGAPYYSAALPGTNGREVGAYVAPWGTDTEDLFLANDQCSQSVLGSYTGPEHTDGRPVVANDGSVIAIKVFRQETVAVAMEKPAEGPLYLDVYGTGAGIRTARILLGRNENTALRAWTIAPDGSALGAIRFSAPSARTSLTLWSARGDSLLSFVVRDDALALAWLDDELIAVFGSEWVDAYAVGAKAKPN